jgi:hypothetical protein
VGEEKKERTVRTDAYWNPALSPFHHTIFYLLKRKWHQFPEKFIEMQELGTKTNE